MTDDKTTTVTPPPEDLADVIAGAEEAERGEGVVVTIEEFDRLLDGET